MDDDSTSRTKVARVIREYGLDDLGRQLEEAWTGVSGERTSLRDLAAEFNEAVLEVALRDAGSSPLDFEVSGTYESLQSDSKPEVTRARRRLEREGVDPEALERDFVTHQAVHTYLTKDRGATLPEHDADAVDHKVETVEKLQGRVAAVTESAIDSLASSGDLDRDTYDVLVDVRAVCPECGSDYSVGELFRQGGCECHENN